MRSASVSVFMHVQRTMLSNNSFFDLLTRCILKALSAIYHKSMADQHVDLMFQSLQNSTWSGSNKRMQVYIIRRVDARVVQEVIPSSDRRKLL